LAFDAYSSQTIDQRALANTPILLEFNFSAHYFLKDVKFKDLVKIVFSKV